MIYKVNSIKVLLCVCLCAANINNAKPQENTTQKRLAVGIELLSSTGFGIEAAATLHPQLTLRGGISLLPVKFVSSIDLPLNSGMRNQLTSAFANPTIQGALTEAELPRNINHINTDMDVTVALGLENGKLLVDFHPLIDFAFKLTAGVYIGSNKLWSVEGKLKQTELMQTLTVVRDNGGPDLLAMPVIENYDLNVSDLMNIDAAISINAVKPYIGIGFGRALPERGVGISLEIGALFWGKTKITNTEIQKMINEEIIGTFKSSIYPVISLKINFGVLK